VLLQDEKGARGDLQGQQVTTWRYITPDPPAQIMAPPPPPVTPHPLYSRDVAPPPRIRYDSPSSGLPSEDEILDFIEDRNEARKSGDYAMADRIRDDLKARGVLLQDDKGVRGNRQGQDVTTWRYCQPEADVRSPAPPPPPLRPPAVPSEREVEKLIEQRNEARKSGDYARADSIRDGLKSRGVILMDEKNVKGDHRGREVTTWRYWSEDRPD
jgi:hypothetical protein